MDGACDTLGTLYRRSLDAHAAGRLDEAEAIGREILALAPDHAEGLHLVGVIECQRKRFGQAEDLLRRAIAADPTQPQYHRNLGLALSESGRFADAEPCLRAALALRADYPEAFYSLGNALLAQDRVAEAVSAYREALTHRPDYAEALNGLGMALYTSGKAAEAEANCRAAIRLKPDFAEAHNGLGIALMAQGRPTEAETCYRESLLLSPGNADALNNLGNMLFSAGQLAEAEACYGEAIRLRPDDASFHTNRAMGLLLAGRFEEGWPEYEWRWQSRLLKPGIRNFATPPWRDEALAGRTLLLHAEQGHGDTLQFCRYATLLPSGGTIVMEVQPGLKRLLSGLPGVDRVIARGEPLPAFDLHCPLMSLPLVFGTRLETIPAKIPYLAPTPAAAAAWRVRLSVLPGLKVGLVWAGQRRDHAPVLSAVDARRSLTLQALAPLGAVAGVTFISLQKGAPAAEAAAPPAGLALVDYTAELADFADTAALIDGLDLVISVDTSVAHLAGAMGKPVWLLNRYDTCWRWLQGRDDSPWYPSLRQYRQPEPGDWPSVLDRVREDLARLSEAVLARSSASALQRPVSTPAAAQRNARGTRVGDGVAMLLRRGYAAHEAGKFAEAEADYRRLLGLHPEHADALHLLGLIAHQGGRNADAVSYIRRAIAADGSQATFHCNLGTVFIGMQRPADAERSYREALRLRPDYQEARNNLGNALFALGHLDEAEHCYRAALRQNHEYADAWANLGIVEAALGRPAEADASYARALALRPDQPTFHANRGISALLDGRFKEGWEEFEWRWRVPHMAPGLRNFTAPTWNGEPPSGRTLLLHAEQGLGDTLQFCRYASLLPKDATVILEVQPALVRLLTGLPGVARVIAQGEPIPDFDLHCPLLSLPRAFGTTLTTIPADVPYLAADPAAAAAWRERLSDLPGLKVGLVWAGKSRAHLPSLVSTDARRSVAIETLAPLADVPGVSFISLQKGEPGAQAVTPPAGMTLHDFTADLSDFADTAALIDGLDLVISVDTSVAHLAGAMGKTVWLLNRFDTCWRWMLGRDDSPWYPSLRQFRQPRPGDWASVLASVRDALTRRAGGEAEPAEPPPPAPSERPADAVAAWRRTIAIRPDFPDALNNLGLALFADGQMLEAMATYRQAMALAPGFAQAHNNLARTLAALGRFAEADAIYCEILRLRPDDAGAHANRGMALLLGGALAEGWREYEWRWKTPHMAWRADAYAAPRWTGEPLAGRTLLLHAEQGLGDTLQFCRYVPVLARQGRIVLAVQPQLVRLLGSLAGVHKVIAWNQTQAGIDLQCPSMSVPGAVGTLLETIPADIPYLAADLALAAKWRKRLEGLQGLKVGLVWAGDPWAEDQRHALIDARRSISLALLAPLASVVGASFVSLQKGKAGAQAATPPTGMTLHDFTAELDDFADTAALIDSLDLIISVDTSVAHLAGAMGKPVWLLNRFDTCWRWMRDRDDSPWYPTLRQFRQPNPGDWSSVIAKVRASLANLARSAPPTAAPHEADIVPNGPTVAEALFQQGLAHHQAGRFEVAETAYREALAIEPFHAESLHLLGAIAHQRGQYDQAVDFLRMAIAADAGRPFYHCRLGHALQALGRPAEAAVALREAVRLRPDFPEALDSLGLALSALGLHLEAEQAHREALRARPNFPGAQSNLGNALAAQGRTVEAEASYREALTQQPRFPEAMSNLAVALASLGRWSEAEHLAREALRDWPASAEAHGNLGMALVGLGQPKAAAAAYLNAQRARPEHAEFHANRGMALLLGGDFDEGWREFEWRWRTRALASVARNFAQPQWMGEPLAGRTLLLHAEQGLGDTLQFCRYASLFPPLDDDCARSTT